MKLTEEDFTISESDEGISMMTLECGCERFEPINDQTEIEAKNKLKIVQDQLLENQDKAEKWDKVGHILVIREQEIKQLKEDNDNYNNMLAKALHSDCVNCNHDINSHYGKNESDKIQRCHNSDEKYNQCSCIKPLTENDNLKHKLEKIEKHDFYEPNDIKFIKEILEGNK